MQQCAIPVFDGLLPEPHNKTLMSLLFRLAEWHALAKLRMHTESTLTQLEKVTSIIGRQLRDFSNITCKAFKTTELPKEAEARARRETRQQKSKQTSKDVSRATMEASSEAPPEGASQPLSSTVSAPKGKKAKTLNLFVYKIHALGDYAATIRLFGTTDSYSSQIVSIILYFISMFLLTLFKGELQHRRVKRLYGRTNKNKHVVQMTRHERRETRILRARRAAQTNVTHSHLVPFSENEPLPYTAAQMHHDMAESKKHPQDAFSFSRKFPDDPASKVGF